MFANILAQVTNFLWFISVPFIIITTIYLFIKVIPYGKKLTLKLGVKDFSEITLSLASKIGTGAIIGILGGLSKFGSANFSIEGMVLWGAIASIIMLPLTYTEVFVGAFMGRTTDKYIEDGLNLRFRKVYSYSLVLLYVFGFGGLQISGMQGAVSQVVNTMLNLELNTLLLIITPLIAITILIVVRGKDKTLSKILNAMVSFMLIAYLILFVYTVVQTIDHIPTFVNGMFDSVTEGGSALAGIAVAFMLASQRILQSSEAGLGTSSLASTESTKNPKETAILQVLATAITIIVALGFTTYIASYGESLGLITFPSDGATRLAGFFQTIDVLSGGIGVWTIVLFIVASGMTTLLASSHFVKQTLDTKYASLIYAVLLILALVVNFLNASIVFDVIDLLTLVLIALNIIGLIGLFRRNKIKK